MCSKPAFYDSNIDRLLGALHHVKMDRPPNFEIVMDGGFISWMLGRKTQQQLWDVTPRESVEIVHALGQDATACSMTWRVPDGSILTQGDLDAVRLPDMQGPREKMKSYLAATAGTNVGVCARLSGVLAGAYLACGPVPIESFMYMLYDEPEIVNGLFELYTRYALELIEAIKDLPYHFYYIGDDIASSTGSIISPAMLDVLWAERTEMIVNAALATGRPVLFHCCGKLDTILPYLIKWNVNAVHPIQPVANDIYAIHAQYGKQLTLVGNMDIAGALSFGTPKQVREDTFEHIKRLSGDGGYVVCSSHSIIDTVKPENYVAMVQAAHDFVY